MSSVKPGDVLAGKYRVERVLGSGGMGYVVAARHLQLDQLVAMKFLRKGGGTLDETEATGRFLREAKAVVRLRDEHVARVMDVGTLEGGEPYIVMEYLDGQDLSAIAKARGAIPVPEAVEYLLQACEALAEAHSLGIVHRDVKLANLFVTRGHAGSPLVKVLDFGISKVNPFGEQDHEMTRTSSMLGSPRFMSPEQMRDPRTVDPRSDIWSLGVVLYRLVAGKPPFEAETLGRLLTMVMHETPDPLAAVRGDLPFGFSEVVGRCLEKDPSHRYVNIADFAYALVPFAMDPARARAAADRAAATLSMAPRSSAEIFAPPSSGTMPSSAMYSGPPAQVDTGTAAPWVGTHGGGRSHQTRNVVVYIASALALIVGVGLFALKKTSPPPPTDALAEPSHVASQPAPEVPITPTATAPASETPADTSAVVASPNLLPKAQDPHRATAGTGGARKTVRGGATTTSQAPAPPATRTGDGIPSTRD